MNPSTVTAQVPGASATPAGAQEMATRYYDVNGRMCTSDRPVPIDQYGKLTATEYRCRKDGFRRWFPLSVKEAPVCPTCRRRMEVVPIVAPSLLPWRELWSAVERPLRPVWGLPAALAVGAGVDAAQIPALVFAGLAVPAGVVARRMVARAAVKAAVSGTRFDRADPEGADRLRASVERAAREASARPARLWGYGAAAALSWLALAAATGVDPSTVPGLATWAVLGVGWLVPAATWWRKLRRPEPEPVVVDEPIVLIDETELEVKRIWDAVVAVRRGQPGIDGRPSERDGALPGTRLLDWQRIQGGWSATIAGKVGEFESERFLNAVAKIAAAYRMHRSMVTVMPDPEDENQSTLMVQRSSPVKDRVAWAGPGSIDVQSGTAEVGRYVDGAPLLYELYRPGWGAPHDFLCGTTGAGKSETLSGLLIVDRWASFVDADGVRRGMVADLLIDPQQGQSYEPFMDDLAAPVATSIEEAMLVVEAFRREMLRRNAYLSKKGWRDAAGVLHRAEWTDARGRPRFGRKAWDPLLDGPILTLNIDEAHEYLAVREFAQLVTAGARMYRKCGMRIRVSTHTPLLTDLGGSMALRDMLTGGFVWVGRTANSLSGPTAFNGRLPVDPRSIPAIPGAGFTLGRLSEKPMLSRFMWEPDYYDLVRNADEEPIGFPAELPAHTLEAFGPDFAAWSAALRAGEEWQPGVQRRESIAVSGQPADAGSSPKSVDAVLSVLATSPAPMDIDELDAALTRAGTPYSTRTVREALKKLRDRGLVFTSKGRHEVTPQVQEDMAAALAEKLEESGAVLDESSDGLW